MKKIKYPDDFINKIINGDWLEVMKDIPNNSIDLVVTDPPYNISQDGKKIDRSHIESKSMRRTSDRVKRLKYDFGEWDKFKTEKDFLEFTNLWIGQCSRILKPNGSFYSFFDRGMISYFETLLEKNGFHIRSPIVWHKRNPIPMLFKVGYMSACEFISFATKNKGSGHIFNYQLGQQHNFIETPICQGNNRTIHPTQKPEEVIKVFIEYSSNKNALVIDPFMGSGTTAIACKKLNRNFIGIEKNLDYVKIAEERLKKVPERLGKFLRDD